MAIAKRGDRFRAEVSIDGRKICSKTFATRAEAEEMEAAMKAERDEPKQKPITAGGGFTDQKQYQLQYFLQRTLEIEWHNVSKKQRNRGKRVCRRFGLEADVRQIKNPQLEEFMVDLRNMGLDDTYIKHELNALIMVLKRAKKLGVIDGVPDRPAGLKVSKAQPYCLKPEWIEQWQIELVDMGLPIHAKLIKFMHLMACRISEPIKLEWKDVNFTDGLLTFRDTKNGKDHTLPIWEETEQLLLELKKLSPRKPFDISYNTSFRKLKAAKERVCYKLKLDEEVFDKMTSHKLRHTGLSDLAKLGAGAHEIKEWANHSNIAQSQSYVDMTDRRFERLLNLKRSQEVQEVQEGCTAPHQFKGQ